LAPSVRNAHGASVNSRFDATFRLSDGDERLCFGLPAGLCEDCQQLYIDPDLIDMLDPAQGSLRVRY
jgi:hypothetical protein